MDKVTNIRQANWAWEQVMTAHARLIRAFATDGVFTDVSMREYDVLYTLSKGDRQMRLNELQDAVLLSQPALSRLVDRLVKRGLVARCADETDRRALRIWLTEEGRRTQRRVGSLHAKSVAQALDAALTPPEILKLGQISAKLAENAPKGNNQ